MPGLVSVDYKTEYFHKDLQIGEAKLKDLL